jgi:hypothetical protein
MRPHPTNTLAELGRDIFAAAGLIAVIMLGAFLVVQVLLR